MFSGYPCFYCNGSEECVNFCDKDLIQWSNEDAMNLAAYTTNHNVNAMKNCNQKAPTNIRAIYCPFESGTDLAGQASLCTTKMNYNEVVFRGCANGKARFPPRGIKQALDCEAMDNS